MVPSIAIVGGGPAGLCLARLLHVSGIEVSITVFERDASPDARVHRGGTLDLHPRTGLNAMKKAGLWEQWLKHARYEGEELVIADKNATEYVHVHGSSENSKKDAADARPEIDRAALMEILLASLPAELMQWGKKLSTVDETTHTLNFADGTQAGPFDLIVGADGAWSKVRSVVSDAHPRYAGMCGLEGRIPNPAEECPRLSKWVGNGSYFSYSDQKSITFQRMGDGSVGIGTWILCTEDYHEQSIKEAGGIDNTAALTQLIVGRISDWQDDIKELLSYSKRWRSWVLHELPVGHRWDHKKGFTLMGDAAHLMTPFAGEGVNAALTDALELRDAIVAAIEAGNDIDEGVLHYETAMFPRARFIQQRTMNNKNAIIGPNPAVSFLIANALDTMEERGHDLRHGWRRLLPVSTVIRLILNTIGCYGILRRRVGDLFRSLRW